MARLHPLVRVWQVLGLLCEGNIITAYGAMLCHEGSILMSCLRRWVGVGGYIIFLIIGTATIPQLYPPAKW